jgi:phosphomannomutase
MSLVDRALQSLSCLLSASLIFTSVSLPAQANSPSSTLVNRLAVPSRLGMVTDSYGASDKAPAVVLIQDLHLHYPTQKRIARLLSHFEEREILQGPVAVEGTEGIYDLSPLASYPAGPTKDAIVDYFMAKGELSGDEAYAILKGDGRALFGIDDRAYYGLNRDLFRKTLSDRKDLEKKLASLRLEIDLLKTKHVSRAIRRMDKALESGHPEVVLAEKLKAAERLYRGKTAELVLTQNILRADHALSLLTHLLRQEVTQEEAGYVAQRLPQIVALLNKLSSGARLEMERVEETVKAAIDFYTVALMRDEPLAKNLIAMTQKQPVVVAIAGGFHTEGLTRALKAAGIGYAVVTPQIDTLPAEDYHALYEDRLSGKRLTRTEVENDWGSSPIARTTTVAGAQSQDDAVAVKTSLIESNYRLWSLAAYRAAQKRFTGRTPAELIAGVARLASFKGRTDGTKATDYLKGVYVKPAAEKAKVWEPGFAKQHGSSRLPREIGRALLLVTPSLTVLAAAAFAGLSAWVTSGVVLATAAITYFFDPFSQRLHKLYNVISPSRWRLSLPDATQLKIPTSDLSIKIKFGTSGWRGLMVPAGTKYADDRQLPEDSTGLTAGNVNRMAQAIADSLQNDRDYQSGLYVGVGYDARPGGRDFAIQVVEVLVANGIRVRFLDDITPTPVTAEMTRAELGEERFAIGIHITASHNAVYYTFDQLKTPEGDLLDGAQWMGMKVMKGGTPANDVYTGAIAARANDSSQNETFWHRTLSQEELAALKFDAIALANDRLARAFGFDDEDGLIAKLNRMQDRGQLDRILWNVLHGGTTKQVKALVALMRAKGLKVPADILNDVPMNEGSEKAINGGYPVTAQHEGNTVPWRPEPTPSMYKAKMDPLMKPGVMAGIFDGDGDRAEIYDRDGKTTLQPNELGVIFTHFLLKTGRVTGDPATLSIVRTLPTTRNLDLLAQYFGLPLYQTPVGSKHFEAHLNTLVTGTEESGHLFFRLGQEVFVDSAVAEFLLGLLITAETGKSLKDYYDQDVMNDLKTVGEPVDFFRDELKKKFVTKELLEGLEILRSQKSDRFAQILSQKLGKTPRIIDAKTDAKGVLVEFDDGSWAMYRISGTDGSIRLYGEDTTAERLSAIKKTLSETLLELTLEKQEGAIVAEKLRTPLKSTGDPEKDRKFKEGGYLQEGYGVSVGAAVDGSHAFEGNQGYYAEGGKQAFLNVVNAMRAFFDRHRKNGTPIRYIIKVGIGGQHTPFQGIADGFSILDAETGKIVGEYELGKNFEDSIAAALKKIGADWNQVAVIPSSKSGATDETMVIFVQLLSIFMKRSLMAKGMNEGAAKQVMGKVLAYFRELNVPRDAKTSELFKGFDIDELVARLRVNRGEGLEKPVLLAMFKEVLGHMFFETTDDPSQSRLSAFIRNSGLDKLLGDDAPGFGAMFENVGGRWTADLHIMTFLAYHGLDAEKYWKNRRAQIEQVRQGHHVANEIAHQILDQGITDIALIVPDELFWFGKSNEQNFNESIWQSGFANLIAIPESLWKHQAHHYESKPGRLVINLSKTVLSGKFNQQRLAPISVGVLNKEELAATYADLFSTFYGITNTVGTRLIARALHAAGYSAADVDMNNLENPATKIVQANLFLRQPFVELGKKLVDKRFVELQKREVEAPGAIEAAMREVQALAAKRELMTNVPSDVTYPKEVTDEASLADVMERAMKYAESKGRKFVPFLYLEGEKFQRLRVELTKRGIEWVLQGTGDQHISYQQVLQQPQKYLPFIVSFVPQPGRELPGVPAVGFAKAHLDNVSPHLLRDYFAQASYEALTTGEPEAHGGQGFFLRLLDMPGAHDRLLKAAGEGATMVSPVVRESLSRDLTGLAFLKSLSIGQSDFAELATLLDTEYLNVIRLSLQTPDTLNGGDKWMLMRIMEIVRDSRAIDSGVRGEAYQFKLGITRMETTHEDQGPQFHLRHLWSETFRYGVSFSPLLLFVSALDMLVLGAISLALLGLVNLVRAAHTRRALRKAAEQSAGVLEQPLSQAPIGLDPTDRAPQPPSRAFWETAATVMPGFDEMRRRLFGERLSRATKQLYLNAIKTAA